MGIRSSALLALFFVAIAGAAPALDTERESISLLYEPEQVVTAMRIPEPALESPAILTVLTRAQIRTLGARTVPELLEFVPGFVPWRSVAGDWWPGPRGILDANRSYQVMIDGISINNQFLGTPYWTYDLLDLERFTRIEIFRGPGSALYGSEAFLAVINCITDPDPPVGGTFRTLFGTFNTRGIGVSRIFRSGRTKFDLQASGLSSDGQGRSVPTDYYGKGGLTQEGFTKRDLMLKVTDPRGWTFLAHHVEGLREGYLGYSDNLNDQTFFRRSNDLLSLRYERDRKDGSRWATTLFFNRFSDSETAQILPPGFTLPDPVSPTVYPFGVIEEDLSKDTVFGLNFLWLARPSGRHQVSAGGELTGSELVESSIFGSYASPADPSRLTPVPGYPDPGYRANRSFNLQDDITLSRHARLVVGARHDHNSAFGSAVNPRAGLIYRVNHRWTGKLLYGTAYRNPSYHELGGFPYLRPEHIQTTEFQLLGELASGWFTKFSGFANHLTDRIESARTSLDYRPIEHTRMDGLEFELRKRFRGGQELFGNLSTARRLEESCLESLAPALPHNKMNLGYSFRAGEFDTCLRWYGTSRWNRNWEDPRPALPGMSLVFLTVQKTGFPGPADRVILRVRNLLNRAYAFPPAYLPGGSLEDYPQPGREISLEMNWDL